MSNLNDEKQVKFIIESQGVVEERNIIDELAENESTEEHMRVLRNILNAVSKYNYNRFDRHGKILISCIGDMSKH